MKKIFLCILIVLLAASLSIKAQTGCLIPTGQVYTVPEGSLVNVVLAALLLGPGYKGTPVNQYSDCTNFSQTYYAPNTSMNCRVCPTTAGFTVVVPGVLVTCGVTPVDGKIATATIIPCNLDDYSWTLGAAAGIFGIFVIRRRNKL